MSRSLLFSRVVGSGAMLEMPRSRYFFRLSSSWRVVLSWIFRGIFFVRAEIVSKIFSGGSFVSGRFFRWRVSAPWDRNSAAFWRADVSDRGIDGEIFKGVGLLLFFCGFAFLSL